MVIPEVAAFLQEDAIIVLLALAAYLIWVSLVAFTSQAGGLPPRRRELANLLSLVAGPVGWTMHLVNWFRHRGSIDDGEDAASAAPPGGAIKMKRTGESGCVEHEAPASSRLMSKSKRGWWFFSFWRKDPEEADSELLHRMILEAINQDATDIHFEPRDDHYLARFRVNGILRNYKKFHSTTGEHFLAIIKVMASLDVADKARARDGRFEWVDNDAGYKIDTRVSISPSFRGEKLALRFLNRPSANVDIDSLGMREPMKKALKRAIRHPEGFILIAGTTGSGKTTTAYSILNLVAGPSVNTITIEDPVEYSLPNATQIGVNPYRGITFEEGLTTVLRQDPDVIFIGEMRDPNSFKTGIRASLSGHLVVSTMHARDTVHIFASLRNMGIEESSLIASVKMVVAQRLVRLLCPDCKEVEEEVDDESLEFLEMDSGEDSPLYQPGSGCETCYESGFVGRTGVFEYLTMDRVVKEWLEKGGAASELRAQLKEKGMWRLHDDAREKVLSGEVWLQDAIRSVGFDE